MNYITGFIFFLFFHIPFGFTLCLMNSYIENYTLARLCSQGRWSDITNEWKLGRIPDTIEEETIKTCINASLCQDQIETFGFFLHYLDKGGQYVSKACITRAIENGHAKVVKEVLAKGFDLSKERDLNKNDGQESLLHIAQRASANSAEITELLLAKNFAEKERINRAIFDLEEHSLVSGATSLGEALIHKNYKSAQLLIDAGASLLMAMELVPNQRVKKRSALVPCDEQRGLVEEWINKHGYEPSREFIFSEAIYKGHKRDAIRFLRHGLPKKKQNTLVKIYGEYQEKILDQLLTTRSKAHRDEESTDNETFVSEISGSEESNDQGICPICLEDSEQLIRIASCQHKFCSDCAQETINHILRQQLNFTCSIRGCVGSIDHKTLYQFGVSPLAVQSCTVRAKQKELLKYSDFNRCHQRDCPGGCFRTVAYSTEKARHFICRICGQTQCTRCGEYHPRRDCIDDISKQDESYLKEMLKRKELKKCPNCSFLISKNGGCDHMICKICKHEFNWATLRPYKD